MNRDCFIDKIEKIIEASQLRTVSKDDIKQSYKGDSGKNGIYFLYNNNDEVIYVGIAGNGDSTSFFHRMYGHGNRAHEKDPWFSECKKYRFCSFPRALNEDLRVMERLMIFKKGQPKYNDIGKITYDFDDILSRI